MARVFDIASFEPSGKPRLIEVKTTNGWERTPFYISANELEVADQRRGEWRLLRPWNFAREPRAFELHPPLAAHVSLVATSFRAGLPSVAVTTTAIFAVRRPSLLPAVGPRSEKVRKVGSAPTRVRTLGNWRRRGILRFHRQKTSIPGKQEHPPAKSLIH